MKSPGLMSARVRFALKLIIVLDARAAVATVPSASFIVTVLPSKDWTTPATGGLAVRAGAAQAWARVGALTVRAVKQIVARNWRMMISLVAGSEGGADCATVLSRFELLEILPILYPSRDVRVVIGD